ncbi:MAG: WGxxGxxG family protein [Candidatus Pristimantibacillus sp.]
MNKKWSLLFVMSCLSLVLAIPAFAAEGVNSTKISENRMNATGTRTYTDVNRMGTNDLGSGRLNMNDTDNFSNRPGMRSGIGTIGTAPGTVGTVNRMNGNNNGNNNGTIRPLDVNPLNDNSTPLNTNTNYRTNQYRANAADDNGSDWGWLGLIGLIGLAGLRGRNHERT